VASAVKQPRNRMQNHTCLHRRAGVRTRGGNSVWLNIVQSKCCGKGISVAFILTFGSVFIQLVLLSYSW